jgi:hypothetical protein
MLNDATSVRAIQAVLVPLSGLVAACSTTANLYPVQGPLASQKPLPVIVATADGITGNTGNLSLRMPDGEECSGKWSSVAPKVAGEGVLFSQYGTTLGFSYSGIQPGVNKGQAFMTCSRGTTVEAEFFTGSGTANGYGIARDSNENIFKMLF